MFEADLFNKKLTRRTLDKREEFEVVNYDSLQMELKDFIDSAINRAKPSVTGEDGLAALRVAEDVEKAALI